MMELQFSLYDARPQKKLRAGAGIKLALEDGSELLNPLCLQIENDNTDCHCAACVNWTLHLYVKTSKNCSNVRGLC